MIENLSDKKLLLEDSDNFIQNVTSLFNMFVKETFIIKIIKDAFEILKKEEQLFFAMILKDGYVYNKELKKLSKDLESFILNKKEIQFFDMLCENKNKIITKNMILHGVYEDENASDASLNNFIKKIRKRFEKSFLHTIPNVGYKMIL